MTLEAAITKHYGPADGPDQAAKARARTLRSWGPFQLDPQMEALAALRERDPEALNRMTSLGTMPVELAIYEEAKAASEAAEENR